MAKKPTKRTEEKPDFPVELEACFKQTHQARDDINREIERMKNVKSEYEQAIEACLTEIEKNPSRYRRLSVRGKQVFREALNAEDLWALRRDFRKQVVEKSTVQFFADWDECECRERARCIMLNCDPIWFLGCCYLCASLDVIQCEF